MIVSLLDARGYGGLEDVRAALGETPVAIKDRHTGAFIHL
jgi:hypothetical protein